MIYLATPTSSQKNLATTVANRVAAQSSSAQARSTSPRPGQAAVTGYTRPAEARSTSPRPGQATITGYFRPVPDYSMHPCIPRAYTTSTDQRRPQDLPSVMRGKPPVWRAFSNPVERLARSL